MILLNQNVLCFPRKYTNASQSQIHFPSHDGVLPHSSSLRKSALLHTKTIWPLTASNCYGNTLKIVVLHTEIIYSFSYPEHFPNQNLLLFFSFKSTMLSTGAVSIWTPLQSILRLRSTVIFCSGWCVCVFACVLETLFVPLWSCEEIALPGTGICSVFGF